MVSGIRLPGSEERPVRQALAALPERKYSK